MKTKTVIFLLLFILSSCTGVIASNQTATQKISPTSISPVITPAIMTNTPTSTATTTNTTLPTILPTPSLTPSPLPTQPSSYLTKRCTDKITSEQQNIMNSGSILYYWPKIDTIMSFQAESTNPVPLVPRFPYFSVSPFSGTYIWVTTPEVYDVKNSSGKYYQTKYKSDWGLNRQWLLNDRIIIGHLPFENYYDRKAKDDFYILNLSTGEYQHYHFDLPEYFALGPGKGEVASPLYDPTGTLVAYGWDNPENLDSGMLLWDIKTEREIWRRSGWEWDPMTNGISWQYDGSHVFIVAPAIDGGSQPEISSIDRDGKETQLSNFGEVFTSTYFIHDLVVSPDGNKIALSIETEVASPNYLYSLYVLDINTGEIIDFCTTVFQTMFWSPNSEQLAFISEPVHAQPQLVVLDIESGNKMTIDEHTRGLYGWVNWSPP